MVFPTRAWNILCEGGLTKNKDNLKILMVSWNDKWVNIDMIHLY